MSTSRKIELPKIILFYTIMTLVALVWMKLSDLSIVFFGIKGLLEAYVLAFLLFISSLSVSNQTRWGKNLEELFASLLVPISTPAIFLIALSSSVGEEMLFRGAVQNQFGLILASILFGLFHFPVQKILIPWTIIAMIMGFLLGSLYLYSGNLLSPIMLHFLINFLNIWTINQKYMTFP